MPLLHKKEFERLNVPDDVNPDSEVFFLPSTREVFLDYDEYFERMMLLNSSIWTCSVTSKPGLTYEEACQSEKDAMEQIERFPDYLELPILFLVHTFTCRSRIDDLVNDISVFMKDRYFTNEELFYHLPGKRKKYVRVLKVIYREAGSKQEEKDDDSVVCLSSPSKARIRTPQQKGNWLKANGSKKDGKLSNGHDNASKKKSGAPEVPPPECYTYRLQVIDKEENSDSDSSSSSSNSSNDSHNGIFEDVKHTEICREKSAAIKPRIKLFIRHCTELEQGQFVVKAGTAGSSRKSNSKATQRRKMIQEQQETLKPLIESAQRLGVENTERWKQDVLLLSEDEIQELKTAIKEAKEEEKKRAIEKRRKEREEMAGRKKPRDDLLCDDLKPLPVYQEFVLPSWVSRSIYSDLLSLHNFFCSFSELMPDNQGKPMFSLNQLASAVMSQSVNNQILVDVFKALLNARRDLISDEDGDEADVNKSDEIGNELVCDLDHRVHGQRIKDINKKHEMIRNCHGANVREFRINQSTVTEVIRLSLETSGYYPINSSRAKRQQFRGGLHCFDDEGYLFVLNNPGIMQKLEMMSIFELSAEERMAILKVFVQQLLSFQKFREEIDERINQMNELRRELKSLNQWNREQDKGAREAHQAREAEIKALKVDDQPKESDVKEEGAEDEQDDTTEALPKTLPGGKQKKRPSKELLNLRSYLRLLNEGKQKRIANTAEMKRIILESLPFEEMDLREIDEFRELQKELMKEKLDELLKQIYCLQARMGASYLGRDRAYRSYFFLHKYEMLIIEKPDASSQFDRLCSQATPISKNNWFLPRLASEDIGGNSKEGSVDVEGNEPVLVKKEKSVEVQELSPDAERKRRLACTGRLDDCPVHTIDVDSPKFFYFVEEGGVEKLLNALNPRGFREMDLCENISFLKEIYAQKMEKLFEKSLKVDFLRRHLDMRELSDDQDENVAEVLNFHFRSMILQVEKRIYDKRLGNVSCSTTRELWRSSLEELGDTSKFCKGNQLLVQYSNGEVLYSSEQLEGELSDVQRLGISMLQLIHGIPIDCYSVPFASEDKKKKTTIASNEYIIFQRELVQCKSLSALAIFVSTFERAVKWNHVKPPAKCGKCSRRVALNDKQVKCQTCEEDFHLTCVRASVTDPNTWDCTQCSQEEQEDENEEEDEKEAATDEFDEESKSNNSIKENSELPKKDKRLHNGHTAVNGNGSNVVDESMTLEGRKRRAKRYNDFLYCDERSGNESSDSIVQTQSQRDLRKRKKPANNDKEPFNYRSLSMGLRETDDHRKDQLKDPKQAPGYYTVIKNPIDLQTMLQKIKSFEYNTPRDLWQDCQLMFSNCMDYNEDDSPVRENAEELKDFLKPKLEEVIGKALD